MTDPLLDEKDGPASKCKIGYLAVHISEMRDGGADDGLFSSRIGFSQREEQMEVPDLSVRLEPARPTADPCMLSLSASSRTVGRFSFLLGHADLKTTQRYLNVTDEERQKTMQQKLWSRNL